MSDETTTPSDEPESPAADAPEGAGAVAVATAEQPTVPAVPDEHGHPSVPAEPVTFTGKFLMPLLVPLLVAATIIFYVLNVSRIFLASESSLAVIWATFITVAILAGGSALAASPRLRSSSLTLIFGFGLLLLMMGGLISIGAASPNTASGPVQCTPVTTKLAVVAGKGGALSYTPKDLTAKAGCIQLTMTVLNPPHTLQFDNGAAAQAFPTLDEKANSWAATLPAGKYAFHCTIPGHAASGMVGTLTVT
jgi:plastocyanin